MDQFTLAYILSQGSVHHLIKFRFCTSYNFIKYCFIYTYIYQLSQCNCSECWLLSYDLVKYYELTFSPLRPFYPISLCRVGSQYHCSTCEMAVLLILITSWNLIRKSLFISHLVFPLLFHIYYTCYCVLYSRPTSNATILLPYFVFYEDSWNL